MEEELDNVDSFEKKTTKLEKKIKNIDEKIIDCIDPRKTKMIVGFNSRESASIKSFAVKKKRQNKSHHMIHVWQAAHVC